MTDLWTVTGVGFAAFCIWLAVRIINRRERWAKRTAVGLGVTLPLLYFASFGPACWFAAAPPGAPGRQAALPVLYRPIGRAIATSSTFGHAMVAYAGFGMKPGTRVMIPLERDAYLPVYMPHER
jgi:hypothetical protein